ncbi:MULTISPECIES: glycosyltransferase family 2 protein [Desulfococcus]|jgi:GT2 family glycosyltransferase|uniref:Glycosyl transferase family 2 n=1 Tax=Desulfococcus multivorans DSM 2059 TaxID=1121405 RepID=S7UXZ8_DESML|nr:glycosyltransferase family 2 protein [Desulfococcus multivorans]AOY58969.1 glycosyl transferase family 2 [Desulfococcus multivorans]AQV01236.1 hypothetical protein B2D07_10960 [Desulfococcus multivorans]EPR39124.1 glycosyl transferase family 2 [Desulfococcus multivorans DSM 2059]SJZ54393.1 hypothetical protein SAMN02745446_00893 [Desulfococcus multivorans DSM 2059]
MIDVIIVNYNSTDHLLNCIASFYTDIQRFGVTVYVQDNGSTDGVDRVSDRYPLVRLHKNIVNLGFAGAVNQALCRCKGDYVILLNPDAVLEEGFLDAAVEFMDRRRDVGIMGPKILDRDGKLQNSARAFPSPLTALFGRSSYLSRRFPQNPVTSRNLLSMSCDGETPMSVDWVSGACMVVRKKAVEQTGMLDERFFMYWEDADWCRRMWAARWKVVYCPKAVAYHYIGGSSEKCAVRSVWEFHKSVCRFFDKYLPPRLFFAGPPVFGLLFLRFLAVMLTAAVKHPIRRVEAGTLLAEPPPGAAPCRQYQRVDIGSTNSGPC